MIMEMIRREDVRAQRESQERWAQFSSVVSERTGIPVEHLLIDGAARLAIDRRLGLDVAEQESAGGGAGAT